MIIYVTICVIIYVIIFEIRHVIIYICMYVHMYMSVYVYMYICNLRTRLMLRCKIFLAFAHTLGTLRCKIFSCTVNLVTEISWKKRVNIWRNSRFGAQNRGRVITTIQNWHGIVVPERCYQNRGTVKGRRDVYVHDNVNSVCVYVYGTHVYLYIYIVHMHIYIYI